MKSLLLFTAGLAVARSLQGEHRNARRQFTGLPVGELPTIEPVDSESLEPQIDESAVREVIRYGPLTLRGVNANRTEESLDPNGDAFEHFLNGICTNCLVLTGSTYLSYENKTEADIASGVYNHHVFLADIGREIFSPFHCAQDQDDCTSSGSAQDGGSAPEGTPEGDMGGHSHRARSAKPQSDEVPADPQEMAVQLFGSGDDGTAISYAAPPDGDFKAGAYVPGDSKVMHSSEFVNYREEEQIVYLTIDYEYVPGTEEGEGGTGGIPSGWKDASMSSLSVTGCTATSDYYPEENTTSTLLSPSFTSDYDGTIYNMQSHLHDGGVNVRLYVNREMVCDSNAIYGTSDDALALEDGEEWTTITDYERCDFMVGIKKGDEVILESTYDLVTHPLRPNAEGHGMGGEAMGMMGLIFAQDTPEEVEAD